LIVDIENSSPTVGLESGKQTIQIPPVFLVTHDLPRAVAACTRNFRRGL